MKILVTPTSLQPQNAQAALGDLQQFCKDLVFNPTGRPLGEEELIPLLQGCDGYVAGLDFITKKVIESCPDLKVISRYGVGCDRVDLEAAKKAGIIVTNTPGVNSEAVGELAIALLLSLLRKIPYLNGDTKNGGWVRSTGTECKGRTVAVLGLGAIGRVVARCAKGFDMQVMAYDPYIDADYCKNNGIKAGTFEECVRHADVVSLHLPLMDSTRHIINQDVINNMKDGAILINTSRGGLIDEDAAYEALKRGKLGGLGLDAFEQEPPKDSPLFEFENVVVTPHTGAHTKEATKNMADLAVKNVIDVLNGQECRYIVK